MYAHRDTIDWRLWTRVDSRAVAQLPREYKIFAHFPFRSLDRPCGRGATTRFIAFGICANCIGVLSLLPVLQRSPFLAIPPLSVCILFCSTPFVLKDEEGRGGRTSVLLSLAGALWPFNYASEWHRDLAIRISMISSSTFWWLLAWAFLIYPQRRLNRLGVGCVATLGLGLEIPEIYLLATGKWYKDIPFLGPMVALLGATTIIAAIRQFLSREGVERRTLIPVLVAGSILGIVASVSWLYMLPNHIYTAAGAEVFSNSHLLQSLILLFIPTALMLVGLRRRFVRANIAEEIVGLSPHASISEVTEALRRALQDRRVEVWYRAPDYDSYIDTLGCAVNRTDVSSEEVVIPINASDGKPIAAIRVHQDVAREARLTGSGITIEKAPLAVWMQAANQAKQVLASRVEEAQWAQRQRFGRNLHDGIQQRLLALNIDLDGIARQVSDPSIARGITDVRGELKCILEDAARLVHELAPRALQEHGLRAALQSMTIMKSFPVDIRSVSSERAPLSIEFLAYNIASEGLSNTMKHADASYVKIFSALYDGVFILRVIDDGRGGADARCGSGLSGLQDRVEAMGGRFLLDSPPGNGTQVIVRIPIPCA